MLVGVGRLTALVDWGDVEGNEPARDLGEFLGAMGGIWRPEEESLVTSEMIGSYGGENIEAFRERISAHRAVSLANHWCE
jgi:aminoglycoside phosphotransferase (APT) family kinase protein